MLLTTLSIGFTAYADVLEEKAINNFVDSSCEMIREYDADKTFESNETSQNEDTQALDNKETLDFQTCRLIVKADGSFDTYGAKEHIKGFKDFHILQYKDEKSTEYAYTALQNEKNVLSVNIDKIVSPKQAEATEEDTSTDVFPESSNGHLCDWATERTQTAQVNQYIKENNIPLTDITVGVIDQGVDYNHEFLQGRIIRTNFNSSPDGTPDDELDILDGHGTAASSVIVDNTPESVSVAVYRVLDDEGGNSILGVTLGIVEAIEDNVDIINMSLGYEDENDLTKSAVELADEKDIPIVCAAGNGFGNVGMDIIRMNSCPANLKSAITVGATNVRNRICYWSDSGMTLDLHAPGEDINVAVSNNRYDIWDGTSFSSPYVAAAIALIKTVYYGYSYDKIEELLKQSAISNLEVYVDDFYVTTSDGSEKVLVDNFKMPKYPYDIDCPYKEFGYGLIQVGKAIGIDDVPTPIVNYKGGNYIGEIQVELKSDYPVYYTTDGTYPDKTSNLYTEPLTITEDTDLRAVAYDENSVSKYSAETECEYQIFTAGTDDMFEIDENGCITRYKVKGTITNLSVPDVINGITVKTFTEQIFNDSTITKIIFPDTLEEIPHYAFKNNTNLYYVNTGGVKVIKGRAFDECRKSLHTIDMPNVEIINSGGFRFCYGTYGGRFRVNAPKLKEIQTGGFESCDLILFAPEVETLHRQSFLDGYLETAVFPKLTKIEGINSRPDSFNSNCVFYNSAVRILDLPILKETVLRYLTNRADSVQYINMPVYIGKVACDSNYTDLYYYNVTKEAAQLNKLNYYDVSALGGSIRVNETPGLRFGFSYDETQNVNVEEYGFVYSYSNKDNIIIGDEGVKKVTAQKTLTQDNITKFNLVFTNIPESAYEQEISARAYVKIDGQYYYSDILHRSFSSVANAVLNDETIDQSVKDKINDLLNKEV